MTKNTFTNCTDMAQTAFGGVIMGCSDCIHFAVCADVAEMFIKATVEQKPPCDICPNFEDRALWRKYQTKEET